MNAIEKIISQMNEAAEQERAALEQEERMKIDQNFEQKRTQIETEHQKQKEKQIELLEKKYRQLRNRQQVEVRQENLNAKQEFLRRLFADAIAEMENWDESE
ncbi:ATPase V, partial [Enterococcus faecium]|nr:ATPase V [Enterococcus faecium]